MMLSSSVSNTWWDHLRIARAWVFEKLSRAKLTINPSRRNVTHAKVTYLGHVVGLGQVEPVCAKVEAIASFPRPEEKKNSWCVFLPWQRTPESFCHRCRTLTQLLSKRVNLFLHNSVWGVKSFYKRGSSVNGTRLQHTVQACFWCQWGGCWSCSFARRRERRGRCVLWFFQEVHLEQEELLNYRKGEYSFGTSTAVFWSLCVLFWFSYCCSQLSQPPSPLFTKLRKRIKVCWGGVWSYRNITRKLVYQGQGNCHYRLPLNRLT